ncbi:MAG TPA: tRNA lysidine(34) synthetase TilS, partial [Kofleriaceae bacterium]|nr:tRNA lysidine(34) synthetase TilS [Kofleriaceae bacterium]
CAPLADAPPALARWILAGWLRARTEPSTVHVEAVRRLCLGPDRGTRGLDLPGLRVARVYDRLAAEAPAAAPPALLVTGPAGPYLVRPWRPGDRMKPPRLRGHSRKLSDLFIDARVPRPLRATARVVEDAAGTIVWAEHLGPALGADVQVVQGGQGARPPRRPVGGP